MKEKKGCRLEAAALGVEGGALEKSERSRLIGLPE